MRTAIFAGACATLLGGCANFMSGLDSESGFACKAPSGVACQSISGTYHNSIQNNLPSQRTEGTVPEAEAGASGDVRKYGDANEERAKLSPRDMEAMSSGIPIRQPPLVLRVWVAPWEDDAGDLHDQSYFYTMIHPGKWVIESNRNNISNRFRPVYPLNRNAEKVDAEPEKKASDYKGLVGKGDYQNLVEKPNGND